MRRAFSFVYLSIVDRSEKCWPMSFVVIFSFDKPFLHWLFSVSILVPFLHLLVIRKAEELIYRRLLLHKFLSEVVYHVENVLVVEIAFVHSYALFCRCAS